MARDKRAARLKQKKRRQRLVTSPSGRLRAAMTWPPNSCLMSASWAERGQLVQIVVTRARRADDPHSDCAIGVFLVDLGCLGVKNAFAKAVTAAQRREVVAKIEQNARMTEVSPDLALKVIRAGIDYAADLGFDPNPDAHLALLLLHDADPAAATETVPLGGDDGRPLYIAGPNDNPGQIMRQLEARSGPEGFGYMPEV